MKYGIIYTDPPWPQQKGGCRRVRPRQTRELDYPTLSLPEITELHKQFFQTYTAERHNVLIWTVDRFLSETESMMAALGYRLHCRFIWDKGNGPAPAFTVRFTHEYLLWYYVPGRLLFPCAASRGVYPDVIRESATVHSKKPEIAYTMLEAMFPDVAKVELFARQARPDWDAWGNEIPNTIHFEWEAERKGDDP